MIEKKKTDMVKGAGDACPQCSTALAPHAPVVKSRQTNAGPVALPASRGVAECPKCGYVLTEPAEIPA